MTPFVKKVVIGSVVFSALLVIVIIIGVSFKAVDDGSMCLLFNLETRVVEPEPYLSPGSHMVGPSMAFICYPKQIQSMTFADDSNQNATGDALTARTAEGLMIGLELNVEYRLLSSELYTLFDEVGQDFEDTFVRLARSTLRNSASKFPALFYLSRDLKNISTTMTMDLNPVFAMNHAMVVDVQITERTLPEEFDASVQRVTAAVLDANKAKEERLVRITTAERDNRTAVIQATARRETILMAEERNVVNSELERSAATIREHTAADLAMLQAATDRDNELVTAAAELEKALALRQGKLIAEETEQQRLLVVFETEIQQVRGEGQVSVLQAEAAASRIAIEAQAEVARIRDERRAFLAPLVQLKADIPSFNGGHTLQYMWFDVLKAMNQSLLTVDYTKVPLFAEAGTMSTDFLRMMTAASSP